MLSWEKLTLSDTVEIRWYGVYIDVSQTKHGIMQGKTSEYMPRVNIKLNCSMFCCTLLYVHFSIAIILMGKRELIALLNLSSWCLVMVERLFLTVPRGCLQFVIVVFPDHTHLLFLVTVT